jgi:hypothetical protein
MSINTANLDFWIKNGYNVLFVGHAGVGKTSIVKDVFNRHGLNWKYFSAATMDPWVDLVGVPKERLDENGEAYLDLLRCQGLDDVEAFFFDELNRSKPKVRNAVMELIQFRTINGKPFKKLKAIWAAINPDDDDTYDVEKLDPAQADRFHIKVTLPYEPDKEYFSKRYGTEITRSALNWWKELDQRIKLQVSPRRLDYALEIYNKNGDIRFVLPEKCNVSKLITTLKHGPVTDILESLQKSKDIVAATEFITNENNYQNAIDYIKKSTSMMNLFFPLLSAERLATLASEPGPLKYMLSEITGQRKYAECITNVYTTGTDKGACREIGKAVRKSADVAEILGKKAISQGLYPIGTNVERPYFSKHPSPNYQASIRTLIQSISNTHDAKGKPIQTIHRKQLYTQMTLIIPPTLSVAEAVDTLMFINAFATRSHDYTVENLDHLMGVVNHCLHQIHNISGQSLEKIVKAHNGKFHKLWRIIRDDQTLSSKLANFNTRPK